MFRGGVGSSPAVYDVLLVELTESVAALPRPTTPASAVAATLWFLSFGAELRIDALVD